MQSAFCFGHSLYIYACTAYNNPSGHWDIFSTIGRTLTTYWNGKRKTATEKMSFFRMNLFPVRDRWEREREIQCICVVCCCRWWWCDIVICVVFEMFRNSLIWWWPKVFCIFIAQLNVTTEKVRARTKKKKEKEIDWIRMGSCKSRL